MNSTVPADLAAHGLGQRDRFLAHGGARLGVKERARRLLDDLLVTPLDRAFALAQIQHMALVVAEHLDLDVARLLDVFLDENAVVGEARLALPIATEVKPSNASLRL